MGLFHFGQNQRLLTKLPQLWATSLCHSLQQYTISHLLLCDRLCFIFHRIEFLILHSMKLAKILPFENFTITTKLPLNEVMERLSKNITPRSTSIFSFNRDISKPYTGKIYANTFEISRVIDYKNSFLPNINGTVNTFLGKTEVTIKMKPFTMVIVFMAIWLGFVGLACVGIIGYFLLNANRISMSSFSFASIVPFVMFIFGCLLFSIPFRSEANKSKTFLLELLQGEIV
jgi:hypothetical protein